jgi:hypothetical protein
MEQYIEQDLQFNNKFTSLVNKYLPKIEETKKEVINKKKPKYEYVELCEELEKIYGKQIWALPRRIGYTEYKIREAHKRCVEKGIINIKYLVGIIKKM